MRRPQSTPMPEELEPVDPSGADAPGRRGRGARGLRLHRRAARELPRRAGRRRRRRPELRRGREGCSGPRRRPSRRACTVHALRSRAGWIRAVKASYRDKPWFPPTRTSLWTPSTTSSPSEAARSSPPPSRRRWRRSRCASASRPTAPARRSAAARGARAACWASCCPPAAWWPRPSSPWSLVLGGGERARACSRPLRWPPRGPVLPAPAEDESQRSRAQGLDAGRALPLLGRLVPVGGGRRARRQDRGPQPPRRCSTTTPRAPAPPTRSSAATRSTRPSGAYEKDMQRRQAVHHDGQGPAHRDVDAQRPHLRAECAGRGARAEAARSWRRGRARAASRSE